MSGESTPSRGVAGNPWIPRIAPRPPWEEYLALNGRTTSLRPLPHGGLIMGGGSEVEAGEGFFAGLKRRRVIRVLVLYAVAGWIVIEIASVVLPALNLPSWSVTLVIVLVARSEEHTSELQSLMRISYAVFCLKKKNASSFITK